jgi:hypothetical protein
MNRDFVQAFFKYLKFVYPISFKTMINVATFENEKMKMKTSFMIILKIS